MKIALIGAAGIVFGGVYMSGAFAPGEVYDKPAAEVRAVVEDIPIWSKLKNVLREPEFRSVDVSSYIAPDGSVVWRFTQEGHELEVVRATIAEVGPTRTRVTLNAQPGDDLAARLPQAVALFGSDMVQDLIELAFSEQIDARIENRPFDERKLDRAALAYVAAHPRETVQFQKAFAESENALPTDGHMSWAHSAGEPTDRFGGTRPMIKPTPMAAATPMVDARPTGERNSRYR